MHKLSRDKFKKFHLKSIKSIEILTETFEIEDLVQKRLKYANSSWFNL